MKDFLNAHFEIIVLVFIFVFSTIMLALVKSYEMARWIQGGAVITVIARAMVPHTVTPNTITTTSSLTTPDPNAPEPKGNQ